MSKEKTKRMVLVAEFELELMKLIELHANVLATTEIKTALEQANKKLS